MPNGGLSIYGAGLQLQAVTPGVVNNGNVNLGGTVLTKYIGNNQFSYDTTLALSKYLTLPGGYTGYTGPRGDGDNLFIGQTMVMGALGTNNTQSTILIGSQSALGNALQQCVVVGNTLSTAGFVQTSVAIGMDCFFTTPFTAVMVAIGANASVSGSNGIAIGGTAQANGNAIAIGSGAKAGPGNILIGTGAQDNGHTNVIGIGSQPITDNTIYIGNSSQTNVIIGAYTLSNTNQSMFRQTNPQTNTNSVGAVTMVGTGVGTLTFPANSQTPGKLIKLKATGYFTAASGASTIRIQVQMQNMIFDSGDIALPTVTGTPHAFSLELEVSNQGPVGAAVINASGRLTIEGAANVPSIYSFESSPGLDTTSAWTMSITSAWSTANIGNSWTTQNLELQTVG